MIRLDIEEAGQIRSVDLAPGRHLVGRAAEAELHMESPSVSRRHAWLHVLEDGLWVEDLGSMWGTFVDGEKVLPRAKCAVPRGSLLQFAQVAVWNGDHDEPDAEGSAPSFPETEEATPTLTWLSPESFGRDRTIRMLGHLFGLLREEGIGTSVEQEGCLFVRDWVDADRVCVRISEEAGSSLQTRAWWSRAPFHGHQLLISQSIVDEAMRSGRTVEWSGTTAHSSRDLGKSWSALNISSAVAVPIRAEPDVRGVLYVDRLGRGPSFDRDDLEVMIAAAHAIATKRELIVSKIEREEAARIQLGMLPHEPPPILGFDFDAHVRLCRCVGGDIYDSILRPDGKVDFLVADVSGKGLTAALIAAGTSLLFRALVDLLLPPLEIYSGLHRSLGAKLDPGQFVALTLGELDPATGALRIVVAGIPFPLIVRAEGQREFVPVTAFPAALTDYGPPPTEHLTHLDEGDLLVVFSDGYPEATPDGEDWYGMDSVVELVTQKHDRPLREIREELLQAIDEFVGVSGPSDDQTIFLLRRSSAGTKGLEYAAT
jgi:serine phosphatase RsbU (regulator of sigma subunit)